MTDRIRGNSCANRRSEGLDTEAVPSFVDLESRGVENYQNLCQGRCRTARVFLRGEGPIPAPGSAVAARPPWAPASNTATVAEGFEMALAAGWRRPTGISYGNTIKKGGADTSRVPFALGIRLFAVDCAAEVEKIFPCRLPARRCSAASSMTAPAPSGPLVAQVRLRPRKMAVDVPRPRQSVWASSPVGISFHVGSQQRKVKVLGIVLSPMASAVFRDCAERGINLSMVNMGGGFPRPSTSRTFRRSCSMAGRSSVRLRKHFGKPDSRKPSSRPGRGHGRQCRRDRVRKSS